jgi:hypothetical protein
MTCRRHPSPSKLLVMSLGMVIAVGGRDDVIARMRGDKVLATQRAGPRFNELTTSSEQILCCFALHKSRLENGALPLRLSIHHHDRCAQAAPACCNAQIGRVSPLDYLSQRRPWRKFPSRRTPRSRLFGSTLRSMPTAVLLRPARERESSLTQPRRTQNVEGLPEAHIA